MAKQMTKFNAAWLVASESITPIYMSASSADGRLRKR